MPSNEDIPGTPEYYAKIRSNIMDMANAAGIPVTIDANGHPKMATRPPIFAHTAQAEDPYAATTWGLPAEQDFVCPSGQRCLVRRVDVMDLLGTSMLNKLDFMTSIVTTEHIPNASGPSAAKKAEASVVNALADPESMRQFRTVIDDVVLRVVIKPELFPVPPESEEKVNGRVYIDSVSFTDKTEIFNWAVRGQNVDDLKRFREESKQSVGAVESGESVQPESI